MLRELRGRIKPQQVTALIEGWHSVWERLHRLLYPQEAATASAIAQFVYWAESPPPEAIVVISDEWLKMPDFDFGNQPTEDREKRLSEARAELGRDQPVALIIGHRLAATEPFGSSLHDVKAQLVSVTVEEEVAPPDIIQKSIHTLELGTLPSAARVRLIDCQIGHLSLGDAADSSIELRNTFIATLEISSRRIKRLEIDGGFIGEIIFSRAAAPNPFGDVVVNKLSLDRNARRSETQWLRDMRRHLTDRGNPQAAAVFHSVELVADRQRHRLANNIVSHIYEIGSDFGNSVGRPVVWLTVSFAAMVFLGFVFNFAVVSADSTLPGWTSTLGEPTLWKRFVRSVVFAAQSVLNPLNLFNTRPFVSASGPGWALVCGLLGLMGTVSIALFLLALRRRFKLTGSGGGSDR